MACRPGEFHAPGGSCAAGAVFPAPRRLAGFAPPSGGAAPQTLFGCNMQARGLQCALPVQVLPTLPRQDAYMTHPHLVQQGDGNVPACMVIKKSDLFLHSL